MAFAGVVVAGLVADQGEGLHTVDRGGEERDFDFGDQVVAFGGRGVALLDLGDDGEAVAPLDVAVQVREGLRLGDVAFAEVRAEVFHHQRRERLARVVRVVEHARASGGAGGDQRGHDGLADGGADVAHDVLSPMRQNAPPKVSGVRSW